MKPILNNQEALRSLPKIDDLLQLAARENVSVGVPRSILVAAARRLLENLRSDAMAGRLVVLEKVSLLKLFEKSVRAQNEHSLARAVNATGVVLHTGLGRAPLGDSCVAAIVEAARSCALEIERDSGERGRRDRVVGQLLQNILGVEDGTAVNNNAAATMLAVNTFSLQKEVIISRGELVEIGGSYRMPAVVERAGAKLVEVGTTNRTRLADYKSAVTERTGLIMKVHTSNYRLKGFVEEASLDELVALGAEAKIPVVHDLGSGLLTKSLVPALAGEPTVEESIAAAPDVTFFSGDKLLGGPQAGIIVGKRAAVEAIRNNPMFRAMRLDKLILAALEQTLRLHFEGEVKITIPAIERLNLTYAELSARAAALAKKLSERFSQLTIETADGASEAGSGSAPAIELATRCVLMHTEKISAAELARKLRLSSPAVFSRIKDNRVVLDPRTLAPGDDERIVASLLNIFN